MSDDEKGQLDYSPEEFVKMQWDEETWNDMADGEHERLIELEERDREFMAEFIDSLSD